MEKICCGYCRNWVTSAEYSDKPEQHKEDCPVRKMMEIRLAEERGEFAENLYYLSKGIAELVDNNVIRCFECGTVLEYMGNIKIKCTYCKQAWKVNVTPAD